jgi:hypothetical protein
MEYVDGRTLSKLALDQPDRVFTVAELRVWLPQLCEALDYAHGQARVVHRDLKPANLMVDAAGRLKIADFGISATLSDSTTRVSKATGTSGTPVYMSPQQMMGEKPAVTDDIYGLGATLYDLLTGKPPFYSGNILLQVVNKTPPSLTERRAELGVKGEPIPPEWEATIAACLAKEPKDRPQSAGEVARRLGMAEGGWRNIPARNRNLSADGAEKADKVGRALRSAPSGASGQSEIRHPKSALIKLAALAAGIIALAAGGWYFGVHAPEQKRIELARIEGQRVEAERQRLATEQETERQRLAAAEAARLAAARGGLVVRTTPSGAEVRVGAIALERSPLTLKDQRLGKYPVRVRQEGYEEWFGEVEVRENEFTDLDVTLVRSTGRVVLSGTAGAEVYADTRRLGTLPLTLDQVPTGAVQYSVRLKGHKPADISGEVMRNSELRLNATLEPQLYPQPGQPHENTLGMKFVPVPGTAVLFSIWETREQDYGAFARATGRAWSNANAGATHPAVNVSWEDAQAFCQWLTDKERREDRLGPGQSYRLPTDAEWSIAVGLTNEPGSTPAEKNGIVQNHYPWGTQWPPPRGAGNYAGRLNIDPYVRTSPVGSFNSNKYGLYDLGGNVWEWIEDKWSLSTNARTIRGASFHFETPIHLASSSRTNGPSADRNDNLGFRVVVAVGSSSR